MPQMFDWIFYAIVILPVAYLTFDWLRYNQHTITGHHTASGFGVTGHRPLDG